MGISPVFEETYQQYLRQIAGIDYLLKAEMLGASRVNDCLHIPLYDRVYSVSADGIADVGGAESTPAVRVILSKYVLMTEGQQVPADDPLMTYRDFKDSSPLHSYFTTNTNKLLEDTFANRQEKLLAHAKNIGAEVLQTPGYDCSLRFYALPRIPVQLNFNDQDELFPASCSVLYRASAEQFLDMECLAMTGTLLAGKLIRSYS